MKKLTCAVIDDEPLALQLIESYVKKTPQLELSGSYSSATLCAVTLNEKPVDLIFCDIEMPSITGIEFSSMLPGNTRIIFTTAYSNYAVEGFKVNALDYLLKPISYQDFLKSVAKAVQWFEMSAAKPSSPATGMFVKTEYRLQKVEYDDILFIEGMKDYVKIYLSSGDSVVSLMNMKALEEQLPGSDFFRVHRSYIVNISKVKVIERNRIIFGKHYIPISDSVKDQFFDVLSNFSIIARSK